MTVDHYSQQAELHQMSSMSGASDTTSTSKWFSENQGYRYSLLVKPSLKPNPNTAGLW